MRMQGDDVPGSTPSLIADGLCGKRQPACRESRRSRRGHLGAAYGRRHSPWSKPCHSPAPAVNAERMANAARLAASHLVLAGALGDNVVPVLGLRRLVAAWLVPAPVFAALLPGVLLAAATGEAARFATHSIKRRSKVGLAEILLFLLPLVAASAGDATWLSLWLVATSSTPPWAAVVFALCLSLAIAVALTTGSYLGEPPAISRSRPSAALSLAGLPDAP